MGEMDHKSGSQASSEIVRPDTSRPVLKSHSDIALAILEILLRDFQGHVAFRLADGRRLPGPRNPICTVLIRDPGVLRKLILKRDLLPLVDDYMHGAIDVEGDLEALFELEPHFAAMRLSWATRIRLLVLAERLPAVRFRRPSPAVLKDVPEHRNSAKSIAYHYDVSNTFYKTWLDPQMLYSCAYFSSDTQDLAAAQEDKLDYICRKLRLQAGQSLLDIGCGWGALALWAAQRYGVKVHGITLSQAQLKWGLARVAKAGLDRQVQLELRDYRDLDPLVHYDKIVSVGMFEHIGIHNFPEYFGTVARLLNPGGLFLNHGITNNTGWMRALTSRFINRYIFPDGELTRVSAVCAAMENAGFELLDIENLRRHYALTLRHWVAALSKGVDEAIQASSDATVRLWHLYLCGSAHYFDHGDLNIYQIVAGHRYSRQPVPLRRSDLYV